MVLPVVDTIDDIQDCLPEWVSMGLPEDLYIDLLQQLGHSLADLPHSEGCI